MNDLYFKLLQEAVAIPSISTDPGFQPDVNKMVDWLNSIFKKIGFKVQNIEGYGNPVVVAKYEIDADKPTCLIYGHYDVVPPGECQEWHSDPWQLTKRGDRLFGRGAADNKGQFLVHLATAQELIKTKELAYNLIFFIEGNEESGSPDMARLLRENGDLLKADLALISDGEIHELVPVLEVGYRGALNLTVEVRTAVTDLHSGLYGGVVPNAAHELAALIAELHDVDNRVTIPGFYEGCEVSKAVHDLTIQTAYNEKEFSQLTGTKKRTLQPGKALYEQLWLLPTIQATTLRSGYMDEGYRNAIPATAQAKLNVRLAPTQYPDAIGKAIQRHLERSRPNVQEIKVQIDQSHQGVLLDPDSPTLRQASQLLRQAYGVAPQFRLCGASLPIVTDFAEVLGLPQVLVPLVNDDCRMHAANENVCLENIEKALIFSRLFLKTSGV